MWGHHVKRSDVLHQEWLGGGSVVVDGVEGVCSAGPVVVALPSERRL